MKIDFKPVRHAHYSELDQVNPIRWALLKDQGNGTFVNTTNFFKCKDYFNDFVYTKHSGKTINVYHMPSDAAHFTADGGLYVLVTGLVKEFEHNIKSVILDKFTREWGVDIKITRVGDEFPDAAVLLLNSECLKSTFRISLLSLLIRNCNVPHKFEDFDERLDRHLFKDGAMCYNTLTLLKTNGYLSDIFDKHYYYANSTLNSNYTKNIHATIIHNNGINSWAEGVLTTSQAFTDGADIYDKLHTVSLDDNYVLQEEDDIGEWDDYEDEECTEEEF